MDPEGPEKRYLLQICGKSLQTGKWQKVVTDTSISVHAVTGGGKYGNAKAVSVTQIGNKKNVSKITLKMGKTAQIKAKEIKKDKKIARHRKLCYESSNTKVATVTPGWPYQSNRQRNLHNMGICTEWCIQSSENHCKIILMEVFNVK